MYSAGLRPRRLNTGDSIKIYYSVLLAVSNDATHSPTLDPLFAFKFTMQQIRTSK